MSDKKEKLSASDFVRKVKAEREQKFGFDYRKASLGIHPHICARCGRDFDGKDLTQLTVHHRDGNHDNNPRDGSNWENLCIYCHEDEHARSVLSGQVAGNIAGLNSGKDKIMGDKKDDGMVSLADKLKAALNKK